MPPERRGKRFQDLADRLGLDKSEVVDAEKVLDQHFQTLSLDEKYIVDRYYRNSENLLSDSRLAEEMQYTRDEVTQMRHEAIERIRLLIKKEG